MIYLPFEVLTLRGFVPVQHIDVTKDFIATCQNGIFEYQPIRGIAITHSIANTVQFQNVIVTDTHAIAGTTACKLNTFTAVKPRVNLRQGWAKRRTDAPTQSYDRAMWAQAYLKILGHWIAAGTNCIQGTFHIKYTTKRYDDIIEAMNTLKFEVQEYTQGNDKFLGLADVRLPTIRNIPMDIFTHGSCIECQVLLESITCDTVPLRLKEQIEQLELHAANTQQVHNINRMPRLCIRPGHYATIQTQTGAFLARIQGQIMVMTD